MKTTIELSDSLARRAKDLAREQGTTLRELVDAGLRAELDRREAPAERAPFTMPTADGDGLRPGVRWEDVIEMSYGDRA